jgi:pimeloyl-ACP methyl ester carboxylesterase
MPAIRRRQRNRFKTLPAPKRTLRKLEPVRRINRRWLLGFGVAAACFASRRSWAATAGGGLMTPMPAQVPAQEGVAALGDARLSYWDTGGGGEPVLLLHPNSGSALTWPYQQPVFSRAGYRVIAYSRRGHYGSSPVPAANPGSASDDLHRLVEFLRLGRFHIVASAGGCSVALDYALSHAERLHSLVLAGGRGGVEDADFVARTTALLPDGFDEMPAEFRELGPSYRAANPQGVQQWRELHLKAVTGNREGQDEVNDITWANLSGLRVPVLLLTGDADLYIPPSLLRTFAVAIPGSEMTIIPDAGHATYWEQPELFNRTVLNFLARH